MFNIRNEIWRWSLTKENVRYLRRAKPEFIYMLLCYHCFTGSVPVTFSKCKLNSAKINPIIRHHTGLLRLKGHFSGLKRLSDSQLIPLHIPIALYQTKRNGVIGEEQYQINNPTKPYIIPLQVENSSQGRQ